MPRNRHVSHVVVSDHPTAVDVYLRARATLGWFRANLVGCWLEFPSPSRLSSLVARLLSLYLIPPQSFIPRHLSNAVATPHHDDFNLTPPQSFSDICITPSLRIHHTTTISTCVLCCCCITCSLSVVVQVTSTAGMTVRQLATKAEEQILECYDLALATALVLCPSRDSAIPFYDTVAEYVGPEV